MKYKHLFGPVHSRRLGFSLGVDVVPYKYCPLNCVYCEVQHTTHLTLQREDFFPVEEITTELSDYLSCKPDLDYITFSGAGEPTLYSGIGEVIAFIKAHYPQYKLALLTNGVLLTNASLRKEIVPCDLILPSLDACTQEVFEQINRPHHDLTTESLVEGLALLREEYSGVIWLEVFIIEGINDTESELDCLCQAIQRFKPDRIQLNSLDRPGTEDWVKPAGIKVLNRVKHHLESRLDFPVEIIAKSALELSDIILPEDVVASISDTLSRRPCTAEELANLLGLHINEISKILRQLHRDHKVSIKTETRGVFYSWMH